jgi:hypothetical protein
MALVDAASKPIRAASATARLLVVELSQHVIDVGFDGAPAQGQSPRDLFIAEPKCDELQYVSLALRQ